MKNIQHAFPSIFGALLFLILGSCQKESDVKPSHISEDFYPTTNGSFWNYEYNTFSKWDTSTYNRTEQALRDTIVEDKLYTDFNWQLVRKEKGNYYRRSYLYGLGEEFIFLKDYLPTGGTWTHSSSPSHKAVFTILARHPEKVVNGVTFREVIEVQKQDFYQADASEFQLNYTGHYFYANHVGLIYSFEDYTNEFNPDFEHTLLESQIK